MNFEADGRTEPPGETGTPPRNTSVGGAYGLWSRLGAALAAGAVLLVSGCSAEMAGTAPAPRVVGPAATGELSQEDVDSWLDGLLPAALEQAGIAGATVSVVHGGELLTARGYGRSDTGVGYEFNETAAGDIVPEPVDPEETLFRVGSVSKVATATAVMQLVEAGEVDLDTDVGEYVDIAVPSSFDTDVTLRHLLTHTGGFEERFAGMILDWNAEPDLREYLATEPPEQVYEPGTVPAYSNYGSALAGYVVERVSGQPFEDYVQEQVLDPIGMHSSSFRQPLPEELRHSLTQAYTDDDSRPEYFEAVAGAPAGALTSSATDMARFMLAHLGETDPDRALLDPETLDLMHRSALGEDTLGALADGPQATLGFFEEDRNGHRIIGHVGDTRYFHSHMQIYPDEGTGIFVSLNSSGHEDNASVQVREAVLFGFTDRYFPEAEEEDPPPLSAITSTGAEHAEMAQGTYNSSRSVHSNFLAVIGPLDQTRVEARPDGTVLVSPEPDAGVPTAYEEVEPWVWREVEGQRLIAMRVVDDQVREIGFTSAFTLVRTAPERTAQVALPVLAASLLVLAVSLVARPVGAVVRRRRALPARDRTGRAAQVLTWIASASAVAAIVAWAVVVLTVTGFQDVSPGAIRAVQGLQALAVLGVLPAAFSLFQDLRRRAGKWRCLGAGLVLAALLGVAWFALAFGLLLPGISY